MLMLLDFDFLNRFSSFCDSISIYVFYLIFFILSIFFVVLCVRIFR